MTYAYVQDVAEHWENYARLAAALGDAVPEGLIVHAAGPTELGFASSTSGSRRRRGSDSGTSAFAPR